MVMYFMRFYQIYYDTFFILYLYLIFFNYLKYSTVTLPHLTVSPFRLRNITCHVSDKMLSQALQDFFIDNVKYTTSKKVLSNLSSFC